MFYSAKFGWNGGNGGALNRYNVQTMPAGAPRTRAQFTYHMTPATISITGNGRCRWVDLEAVLRKIEYWHQAPVTKFRIMARQGKGAWHGLRWDGKRQHLSH
jgi:hypothetical protein